MDLGCWDVVGRGADPAAWGRQPSWVGGSAAQALIQHGKYSRHVQQRHPAGRTPAASHVWPSQVPLGAGGGFCCWGIWGPAGLQRSTCPRGSALLAPFLQTDENIPGQGSGRGCRWGAPHYAHPPEPPRLGLWPSACRGAGNAAGALPAAGAELRPRNSPLGPTCAGGSCPSAAPSPPAPTPSLRWVSGGTRVVLGMLRGGAETLLSLGPVPCTPVPKR